MSSKPSGDLAVVKILSEPGFQVMKVRLAVVVSNRSTPDTFDTAETNQKPFSIAKAHSQCILKSQVMSFTNA